MDIVARFRKRTIKGHTYYDDQSAAEDFSTVRFGDRLFILNTRQRRIVERLWIARDRGTWWVDITKAEARAVKDHPLAIILGDQARMPGAVGEDWHLPKRMRLL